MSQSHCNSKADKRIEYTAPGRATIRQYAGAVASRLAVKRDDASCQNDDMVGGLAGFLEVVATMQARQLSEKEVVHG